MISSKALLLLTDKGSGRHDPATRIHFDGAHVEMAEYTSALPKAADMFPAGIAKKHTATTNIFFPAQCAVSLSE